MQEPIKPINSSFERLPSPKVLERIQGNTEEYRGIQGKTWEYRRIHESTGDDRKINNNVK